MYIVISQEKLKQALEGKSDRLVLGGRNRALVIALFGFWLGAAVIFGIFGATINASAPGGIGPEFFVFYRTALTLLALCCYLMGGSSSRLTVDIPTRAFLHKYGLFPVIARRRGHLDEFAGVSVKKNLTTHFSGAARQYGLLAQLVPKESASPTPQGEKPHSTGRPLTLHLYDRQRPEEVEEVAALLAKTLGLPFLGETAAGR